MARYAGIVREVHMSGSQQRSIEPQCLTVNIGGLYVRKREKKPNTCAPVIFGREKIKETDP
jgi:hypothetical protein